ncbi:MAG: 50S ribosomal protein L1 [bacterium (Candidatus Ratteibacteria) CG23_combo_of_CG06-09_8_20_14_all_48_7]|uniref:Large ribosomal subunit protein uL1 n=1 Tax=bacterium (Candidatus Ratteibacteria) CG23_combo_of_CG06-09_8_20_14_all_48_7 TaxID=2014292 RepID=A0A2G9Y886_9BACT|nr:MAG: 50S ribosomal protein L1 [bacterium (Candidatus Ratteibacteria) CG23_combo_of_CG06-09_8_20_14_all_48_7]
MRKRSKRYRENSQKIESTKVYSPQEALDFLAGVKRVKFDETVELACHLGVDTSKGEQTVRGTAVLPHGTGKKATVLALVDETEAEEAKSAGADFVGLAEYITKISEGWTGFDVAITTPKHLKDVAKLGKVLGPRGLMPSPKNGTVTTTVGQTVKELKAGRVEFRMDKGGNLHLPIGKVSFSKEALQENLKAALSAIVASQPPAVKGQFIKSIHLTTTMGPSFQIRSD